jgi:hypothetical protein
MPRNKPSSGVPTSFLQKTYDILCDNSLSSIVRWTEDGRSFSVKNVKEFSEKVLPKYFKHSNFSSFVRQLNMYDFHKMRDEDNLFQHPLFQRDKQPLLKDITRKSTETGQTGQTYLSMTECSGLMAKLYSLHARQQDLEELIVALQGKYQEIRCQNQMLIKELYLAQEREQRIEKLLIMLASFIGKRQTLDVNSMRRGSSLLAIAPVSEDEVVESIEDDPLDYFLSL